MQCNGPCQSQALDITPLGHQILWIVSMANRLHSLGNDWSFVQVVVDIVGSGTNQLDAFFISLMVGPGALEARQQQPPASSAHAVFAHRHRQALPVKAQPSSPMASPSTLSTRSISSFSTIK